MAGPIKWFVSNFAIDSEYKNLPQDIRYYEIIIESSFLNCNFAGLTPLFFSLISSF